MPPPEFYDDWDPDEHALEAERIEALMMRHTNLDLRSLKNEVEAERSREAYQSRGRLEEYRALREAFVADNPEPEREAFEARAEWEWRLNEFIYEGMDRDFELHNHRMERAHYIARVAQRLREAQEWAEDFLRPLLNAPTPLKPWEPIPWPVGDGVSEWRRQRGELDAFGDPWTDEAFFDEPAFAAALDLRAGLTGWELSLPSDAYEAATLCMDAIREAANEIQHSYKDEYLPGTIGWALLHIRDGVLRTQDALGLLDGLSGYDWLTPRAYARLRELLEAALDTATERYAQLREIYDAYYARAVACLAPADAPDVPQQATVKLPPYYDDFDAEAHDIEFERLEKVQLNHYHDDLRSLRSEVEQERRSARVRRPDPESSRRREFREAFKAANPPPSLDEPERRAEWEWRLREHVYEGMGNTASLRRHRFERGAFIERYRASWQRIKDRQETARREREANPPPPRPAPGERPPWPLGDGVSDFLAEAIRNHVYDEGDGSLDEPSFARALDLDAGMTGWLASLDEPPLAFQCGLWDAVHRAVHRTTDAYEREYRPGTIGRAQGQIREGILGAEEALDILDQVREEPWMTPDAYDRLRELVEAVHEAAVERYVELRAMYDAYRERALRILGPEGVAGV